MMILVKQIVCFLDLVVAEAVVVDEHDFLVAEEELKDRDADVGNVDEAVSDFVAIKVLNKCVLEGAAAAVDESFDLNIVLLSF